MTFQAIRHAIKDYCLLSSPDADIRIGQAINRHYRRITASLGLDSSRFVTRAVSTTPGVQTVTFTQIEKIDRILNLTGGTTLLTEVSMHEIRSEAPSTGAPTRWVLQTTDADTMTVRLDTVPQTAYDLQADGWAALADLSGTQEPVFAESFHDILVWAVIAEELLKKEKVQLATVYARKADDLLAELRFQLADSPTRDLQQASGRSGGMGSGAGSGGSGGTSGTTAYTQSALLTFDRGAGIVPFAVAQSDAPYVPHLGAEFLGNIATDCLIGRDTAGTGDSEQIVVAGGLELNGSGVLQRSALVGDVTSGTGSSTLTIANDAVLTAKIANDQVTYAKLQNVSTTARVLGRTTAGAGDPEEVTLSQVLDFVGSAAQGDLLYRGASTWTRLGAGTSGQFLQTLGAAANPAWATLPATNVHILNADVTAVEVVNTVTETTVYTYTVPGGTLGTASGLRLTLTGDYLNNDGAARDLTLKVKYGGTTIYDTAALSVTNTGSRRALLVQATLTALNSASAQIASGVTRLGGGDTIGGTNGGTAVLMTNMAAHVTVAEASAGALALAVTVQHGTASANISVRAHTVQLEWMP